MELPTLLQNKCTFIIMNYELCIMNYELCIMNYTL